MSPALPAASDVAPGARGRPGRGAAIVLAVALLAILFYALTIPANHTEAEDAFDYARQAGQPVDWTRLHPHHLLYIPAMRALFVAAASGGVVTRPYFVLVAASVASAGVALAFFYLLLARRLQCSAASSLAATALLGVTYGFWRYAGEAEIYLPALALLLAALFAATAERQSGVAFVLAAAAGTVHGLTWLPLLCGAGALLVAQGRVRRAMAWCAACAPMAFLTLLPALAEARAGDARGWREVSRLFKAAPAMAHDIASFNFIMAFPGLRNFVRTAYPGRMLGEEIFMGENMSVLAGYAGVATLACFALAALVALARARRLDHPAGPGSRRAALALGIGWLLSYGAVVLAFEPANPEMWIMALPPIVLLVLALVLDPLLRAGQPFPAVVLVLSLLLHNACGGLAPLASRLGDYNAVKAEWLRGKVTADDVLVTADSVVLARYLSYELPCRVVCLGAAGGVGEMRAVETLAARGGTVYVLGDVFDPPAFLAQREPVLSAAVAALSRDLRPRCRRVADNALGGVFVLDARRP